MYNISKQTRQRNKQVRACTKEEKADRGQRPKRKISESSMKLKFF